MNWAYNRIREERKKHPELEMWYDQEQNKIGSSIALVKLRMNSKLTQGDLSDNSTTVLQADN